jgi:hypothetical protein
VRFDPAPASAAPLRSVSASPGRRFYPPRELWKDVERMPQHCGDQKPNHDRSKEAPQHLRCVGRPPAATRSMLHLGIVRMWVRYARVGREWPRARRNGRRPHRRASLCRAVPRVSWSTTHRLTHERKDTRMNEQSVLGPRTRSSLLAGPRQCAHDAHEPPGAARPARRLRYNRGYRCTGL